MWHDDKTVKYNEETHEKRVKVQKVLQEIERAHQVLVDGDKQKTEHKFEIWLNNQSFVKRDESSKKSSSSIKSFSASIQQPIKEPIVIAHFQKQKDPSIKKPLPLPAIRTSEHESKRTKEGLKVEIKFAKDYNSLFSSQEIINEEEIQNKNKGFETAIENKNEWNYSTKIDEKEYVKNLDDFYPRDPYTLMTNKEELLLHRQLKNMTVNQIKDLKTISKKSAKERQKSVNNKKLCKDRQVVYRPKNVVDVEAKRKKSDVSTEIDLAAMVIANDPASYNFRLAQIKTSAGSKNLDDEEKNVDLDVNRIKDVIETNFNADLYQFMRDKSGKISQKYEKVFIC